MSLKIGVLGLTSNRNIGDYLLAEATKYLLKQYSETLVIVDIDLDPRGFNTHPGLKALNLKIYNGMRVLQPLVFALIQSRYLQYLYQYLYWHLKLNWHYKKSLHGLDAIVFSGGGFIKFKTQGLNYLDEQILKIAKRKNIPVMMSAVGIEGYDAKDIRCQNLKRALNFPVVKVITTRDDYQTLSTSYLDRKDIISSQVADPVLWLKEMLGASEPIRSKLIGINLINPNNFRDYGGELSYEKVLNFYKNLITELQLKGQLFKLFSNGMSKDMQFGQRLVTDLNLPPATLLPAPATSKELISEILSFDIILAARMHAGIVSTALEVPTLGLIWSEKIDLFTRIAGIRENYFSEKELDPALIANRLATRSVTEPNYKKVNELKQKTAQYLYEFLDSIGGKVAN
jgi:polysaccharide pyruvyl transferase WcaK-like protein